MILAKGLIAQERRTVKQVVKELAPAGKVNYDKVYTDCSSIAAVVRVEGEVKVATMIFFVIEDCCNEFNVC